MVFPPATVNRDSNNVQPRRTAVFLFCASFVSTHFCALSGESALAARSSGSIGGGILDDGGRDLSGSDMIEWIDSPPVASSSSSSLTSAIAHRAPRSNSKMFPKSDDPDRPFQCPSCPSKFKRANHFKDHLRTHKGELLYPFA